MVALFILVSFLINTIESSAKCGKMWEYHEPEWGQHGQEIYGSEFGYDEGRRTTCVCPEGQWISRIAGWTNDKWNMFEDGLDAISVQCSGSPSWEKSMGYYDDKDIWRDLSQWTVTPDSGPICGLSVQLNEKDHYVQAYKFIYMNGAESPAMGVLNDADHPGTRWYKDDCVKKHDTARILVGFTITCKWTIYTFQPIWEEPKCDIGAVKINKLPPATLRTKWGQDLTNTAFLMADNDWNGGSPVYKLNGRHGNYELFRSNADPLAWRVLGLNYDGGPNKLVMRMPFAAEEFEGFCFEDTTSRIMNKAVGFFVQKNSGVMAIAPMGGSPEAIGYEQIPVEYIKNSAMWNAPLSNAALEWTMTIKNSKTHQTVKEHVRKRKFGASLSVDVKWQIGAKVGVTMGVSAELSDKIGTKFTVSSTNSESFSKTCKVHLGSIGGSADFTVWIWEFTRELKYSQGSDSMFSCHSYPKSGPCQVIPPNCLPGGCNPPECMTCVSPNLELIPHEEFIALQREKFDTEDVSLVDRCLQELKKKCDPRDLNYECCANLPDGEKCGMGEGGCTHSDQCQEGTSCKEQEGDDHFGRRDMSVCVTDHMRNVVLRHSESSVAGRKSGQKIPAQKVGESVEVAAQRGNAIEVLDSDESVTEGIDVDAFDREQLASKRQNEDNWKKNFMMEPPDQITQDQPPKSRAEALALLSGGKGVSRESFLADSNEAHVASTRFTSNHLLFFCFSIIFSIIFFVVISHQRKSDSIVLEFPLLENNI